MRKLIQIWVGSLLLLLLSLIFLSACSKKETIYTELQGSSSIKMYVKDGNTVATSGEILVKDRNFTILVNATCRHFYTWEVISSDKVLINNLEYTVRKNKKEYSFTREGGWILLSK